MLPYADVFEASLNRLSEDGGYRVFIELERKVGAFPTAIWRHPDGSRRPIVVWCSNDYLGMGHGPEVLNAMHVALDRYGAGAGGTRNISGTAHEHVLLERDLADLHGKEAALLFTSGYVSNRRVLSVLGQVLPGSVILSDADNHNSMIEGICRSGAARAIFRHNDVAALDALLAQYEPGRPKVIAFESVYSMDREVAPIAKICDVAESHAEREAQQWAAATLMAMMRKAGLPVLPSQSHILPVRVGDAHLCRRISEEVLARHGIYAQPINYPTVPRGSERLRITPTPLHTEEHMEALVGALVELRERLEWGEVSLAA